MNDEARMTKGFAAQSFGGSHDAGVLLSPPNLGEDKGAILLLLAKSVRALGFNSGTARTIIRRKCFVSRASFRHVPMVLQKFLLRNCVIGFDVIRANACCCSERVD